MVKGPTEVMWWNLWEPARHSLLPCPKLFGCTLKRELQAEMWTKGNWPKDLQTVQQWD